MPCTSPTARASRPPELVRRLHVSPASISEAVGELEAQELIRREREPRHRRDRYVIDDDAWYRAWLASARQNAMLADIARRGPEILGSATSTGMRLQDMSEFLDRLGHDMVQAAERWWQVYSARRMADGRLGGDTTATSQGPELRERCPFRAAGTDHGDAAEWVPIPRGSRRETLLRTPQDRHQRILRPRNAIIVIRHLIRGLRVNSC